MPTRSAASIPVAEVEPELGVVLTGRDVFVRVHVDARGDAQLNSWRGKSLIHEHLDSREFVEAVDHDVSDTFAQRHAQLVDALVVPVHDASGRGHART